MNKSLVIAHAALLAVSFIYGLNYIVAKDVMTGYIDPLGFVFIRISGAMLLFIPLFLSFKREPVRRKDLGRMALCGFFGVALNQTLFFSGLQLTSPINAAIMMTTNPILVLVIASFIIKERINVMKMLGIVAGLGGALILISFGKEFGFGMETIAGDVMVFINAVSYAVYLVLVKPLMKRYSPLTVITWVFSFGFLYVIPFGYGQFSEVNWDSFSTKIWLEVGFVILFTTFFAYLLNIYALRRVSPTVVSFYIYSQPLLAALIAISIGLDRLDWVKVVSAVLIFTGVYLVGFSPSRKSGIKKA